MSSDALATDASKVRTVLREMPSGHLGALWPLCCASTVIMAAPEPRPTTHQRISAIQNLLHRSRKRRFESGLLRLGVCRRLWSDAYRLLSARGVSGRCSTPTRGPPPSICRDAASDFRWRGQSSTAVACQGKMIPVVLHVHFREPRFLPIEA